MSTGEFVPKCPLEFQPRLSDEYDSAPSRKFNGHFGPFSPVSVNTNSITLNFSLTIGVEWSNVAELVDSDILSDAITFIQLETSIGVLCAPLLGGYISDKTGDYSYVFYIAGILLYSSAACAIAGK